MNDAVNKTRADAKIVCLSFTAPFPLFHGNTSEHMQQCNGNSK
jgi:hypothetical protein